MRSRIFGSPFDLLLDSVDAGVLSTREICRDADHLGNDAGAAKT
jgi:hypothetical protein